MARTVSDLLEVQFFCKEAGITAILAENHASLTLDSID